MASKPNGHAVVWPIAEQQINELPEPAWGSESVLGVQAYAPQSEQFPQLPPPAPIHSQESQMGFQQGARSVPSEPYQPFAPWAGAQQQQQAHEIVEQHMAMATPGRGPVQAYGELEPPGEARASHLFGLATVLVGTGAAIGFYYGGAFGGLAGSLFGGASVNAYRAFAFYRMGSPEADNEAKVSGTYAVIAAGLAGYLAYKHAKPRVATANPEAEEETEQQGQGEQESCATRPVGP